MKQVNEIDGLIEQVNALNAVQPFGRITWVDQGAVQVSGLGTDACLGDRVKIRRRSGDDLIGEIVQLDGNKLTALLEHAPDRVAIHDRVFLAAPGQIFPSPQWIGRVIDASGQALDGKPLPRGMRAQPLRAPPPPAAERRPLGQRLETALTITNTLLPIVKGQRIGLFAGSGIGKSTLLGTLASKMEADVVVIAMIGERGREVRHFIDDVLGPEGLARAVVVAATSDQSALLRRRSAWTAMAVAEYFRDQGKSVLFLADSITRFAEAHREVAVSSGEAPVLRGYPPSTAHLIMQLCERAGPGHSDQGDITGIFSVLVAGSDMDEPIADILRGVLDGHVILDREIAERGRFPAIDVLRSVSRSLPTAATEAENKILKQVRKMLGVYERNSMMIRAGLYTSGSDPEIDQSIALWPELDNFFGSGETGEISQSFRKLELILRRAKAAPTP